MKRNTRVGLVTSGGDCQGLNAAIRGVGKALLQYVDNVEIYGMYDGYKGLIEGDYKFMDSRDFSGILIEGGTILGTSRQRYIPGKAIVDDEGNDLMPAMLNTYLTLIVIGGGATISEWKRIYAPTWKKIAFTLTFPLFMFTYIPISFAALFARRVTWKPIVHTRSASLQEIRAAAETLSGKIA